jgi:aldose 1-epimerase
MQGRLGDIYRQELMINGSFYTPVDEATLPPVIRRPKEHFILPQPRALVLILTGKMSNPMGTGYDHNWVLLTAPNPWSGCNCSRSSIRTDDGDLYQPGVQLYTANWIDREKGKEVKYSRRWSFALRATFAGINKPHFPSTILNGEVYENSCIHRFLTKSINR